MSKKTGFDKFLAKQMQDPVFRAEYAAHRISEFNRHIEQMATVRAERAAGAWKQVAKQYRSQLKREQRLNSWFYWACIGYGFLIGFLVGFKVVEAWFCG